MAGINLCFDRNVMVVGLRDDVEETKVGLLAVAVGPRGIRQN